MKLRFDKLFVMDPRGKAGGLAVMWRNDIKVDKLILLLNYR